MAARRMLDAGARLGTVQIEIGPVSRRSAVAWIAYGRAALGELRAAHVATVAPSALDRFGALLDEWDAVSDAEPFHWITDEPPERVEFLMKALYSAGLEIERGAADGRMTLRPADADEFHIVMVRQVLDTLAHQGRSNAEFVESLRNEWLIARPE